MRKPKTLRLLIPVLAVALAASACGGGSSDTDANTSDDVDTDNGATSAGRDNADSSGADSADTTSYDSDADSADGDSSNASADTDDASADSSGADSASDNGDVIHLGPDDVELTSRLIRFGECDELLDYIHTEYAERVGPWGFEDGTPWAIFADRSRMDDMAMADEMEDSADGFASVPTAGADEANAKSLTEGVDYSGTNVQEAGVDEADIIKTDGNRIFTLSEGLLVVTDTASRHVVGSVEVAEGWSAELLINGDDLLLIKRYSSWDDYNNTETILQQITITDNTPKIVETLRIQGDYVSARSVGGTARVIIRYDPQHRFPFVYPQSKTGEQTAEAANRSAVMNSTIADWLPRYTTDDTALDKGRQLTACDNTHAPSVFSGFGVAVVMSVPMASRFNPANSTAVMAPGDTVYASVESIYLATTTWDNPQEDEAEQDTSDIGIEPDLPGFIVPDPQRNRRTSIHRFSITDAANAVYEASGDVPGFIHNQFSLSEHEGHLRVVTTTGDTWGWARRDNAESGVSESQVRVLRQDGDRLVEVGSVGDIGKGERVQSVRFVGDIGYVVTFRQIDPFYTIDLSDPADPLIRGELKIPGFSSYLHPISDDLVLGVGSDADDEGAVTGAKVSLFDVSDLDNPRETAVWTAPDGWSDIGWDHRAFLWWASDNLAVIPVSVHGGSNSWAGAVALRVTDDKITEIGRIDHEDEDVAPGQTRCRRLTQADLPSTGEQSNTGEQALDNTGEQSNTGEQALDNTGEQSNSSASSEDYDDLSQIAYNIMSEDGAVLACGPDESGSMTGFDCFNYSYNDDRATRIGIITDDETLWHCWPEFNHNTIVRSIVIKDELWTLSYPWGSYENKARLQVNDLDTLKRLTHLYLSEQSQAHGATTTPNGVSRQ